MKIQNDGIQPLAHINSLQCVESNQPKKKQEGVKKWTRLIFAPANSIQG